jgi:hypothetical protein
MLFCQSCGEPLSPDARFCPACGNSADATAATSNKAAPGSRYPGTEPLNTTPATPYQRQAAPLQSTKPSSVVGGCLSVIVAIVVIGVAISMCSGGSSSSQTSTASSDATSSSDSTSNDTATTDTTPEPTSTPESIQDQKKDFLASVDESISGAMIVGSPYKYIGDNVDLHCTVVSIPDPSFFNAQCGEDSDGMPAVLVVEYDDAGNLSKGQTVRVMGEVAEPMQGSNAMGGSMNFPTVKAQFME